MQRKLFLTLRDFISQFSTISGNEGHPFNLSKEIACQSHACCLSGCTPSAKFLTNCGGHWSVISEFWSIKSSLFLTIIKNSTLIHVRYCSRNQHEACPPWKKRRGVNAQSFFNSVLKNSDSRMRSFIMLFETFLPLI